MNSYEKIDNTLCLNSNKGNLEFGLDTDEHIDCSNLDEMIDCLEDLKLKSEAIEILYKYPNLLSLFAYDGIFDYQQYLDTFNEDDRNYLGNFTEEQFNKVKEWVESHKELQFEVK